MTRLVNLSCRKCGMSLDTDVSIIQSFCPNCGGELFITVKQMMDILDDRKEIKSKNVKYIKDVKLEKRTKKKIDILPFLMFFALAAMVFLIWKLSY